MDLSGGQNTKKDPHALARNELATSVNTWLGTGNAISKRPGNVTFANGATGSGTAGLGMARAFYSQQTYVLTQSGSVIYQAPPGGTFAAISGTLAVGAGPIRSAQMYDPETSLNTTFIVNGADTPRVWAGPGNALGTVNTTGTHIPYNHTNTAPITPKYVLSAGFYLVYAGEPTEPTAVYISNPYYPQIFNLSATTTSGILPNPYIPYLVGFNDGVQGGDITGIERLADGTATGSILVYKQAAIYRMSQSGFFAEMYWGETLVSSSVGCLSPRSIVPFDTFHCFLGIDGVYQTDGSTVRRISDNVPTFFDSTLTGNSAAILNRTSAIGVRHGQRYILFYDDGNGTGSPAGYCTTAAVFDFSRLDATGLPAVTTIRGMTLAGAVPLRGPNDDGNFAWCNATSDSIAKFGVGSSDLGSAISVSFSGKADFMDDVFGPDSPLAIKSADSVFVLLSATALRPMESLTFTCTTTLDIASTTASNAAPVQGPQNTAAIYGTSGSAAIYGTAIYTASVATQYIALRVLQQLTTQGHVLQFGFSESSVYPWTILGYVVYVNHQMVAL
jgi:hypothetical protein